MQNSHGHSEMVPPWPWGPGIKSAWFSVSIKGESVVTFSFSLELGRYFCDNDVEQLECLRICSFRTVELIFVEVATYAPVVN